MIDYRKFQKSLKNLELQNANYQNVKYRDDLSELDKEGIAESCIQRFETCYDCLWKVLKRYLIEGLGIPEVPNSPKPIFHLANENKLFVSSIESWLSYSDMRVDTSHDYDQDKADNCLGQIPDFIDDAIGLYQTMSCETWE
jgi:nucleotidyltransferase substrate binding protein (TIGR01987 family)